MNNKFNDLELFYFGSKYEEIVSGSRADIKKILMEYSREEITRVHFKQKQSFIIQNDKIEDRVNFNSLKEDPKFQGYFEIANNFEFELQEVIRLGASINLFTEQETLAYLKSSLKSALTRVNFANIGEDPLVGLMNSLKMSDPEQYIIFKTFMQYRPQVWTATTNNALNNNNPQEKITKIISLLETMASNGLNYYSSIEENVNLSTKSYLSLIQDLEQSLFSIPAFLTYLLKHPAKFKIA